MWRDPRPCPGSEARENWLSNDSVAWPHPQPLRCSLPDINSQIKDSSVSPSTQLFTFLTSKQILCFPERHQQQVMVRKARINTLGGRSGFAGAEIGFQPTRGTRLKKMVAFPGGLQMLLVLQGLREGGIDLLFGLWCRLPTEQETYLSVEREMSLTWLPQACIASLIGQPSLCSAGMAGAGTLRREATMHSSVGMDWLPSKVSSFLNKVESSLRPCPSELAGRSLLRFQAAQEFLTGSQESARFAVFVVKHKGGSSQSCPLLLGGTPCRCSLEVLSTLWSF